LLSGVAVIDLQDLIANLSEDNISKKNEHVALLLLYIDQGTLAHSTRRLPHSALLLLRLVLSGQALQHAILACMIAKQSKRSKRKSEGSAHGASTGTESRQARGPSLPGRHRALALSAPLRQLALLRRIGADWGLQQTVSGEVG
jgi:hypothetical protein